MFLLCLGTGVGVTDCHSQCTHWLRNDTGSCMGGAVGRATARVAPTGEAEKSEIFRQGRQKGCPGSGQPL